MAALLGYRVKRAREEAGLTQAELGAKVFVGQARISQIENANDPPSQDLSRQLDDALGLAGAVVELWPLIGVGGFQDYAQPFLRRQGTARTIHEVSLTVPGLLQTAEYARAIMGLAVPDDQTDLTDAVRRRMERQGVFQRDEPPWLWVLLDENALTRSMGGPQVMVAQIERLLADVQCPHINVQVVPRSAPCPPGSFSLLTMPDGERVAYTEGFRTGTFLSEPSDVDRYHRIYDRINADALSTDASVQLMHNALEKHR
ncbi:helix-turn-helix transcriptional regulator [Streptomyces sp. NPDC050703]|uniref:helix-turn-helix domain-containing protein n=1 Tax=Streptomyces sp. NPDC050703 TaxID=3157218 RepID=UPI0034319094